MPKRTFAQFQQPAAPAPDNALDGNEPQAEVQKRKRTKVLPWSTRTDEYGNTIYSNNETGQEYLAIFYQVIRDLLIEQAAQKGSYVEARTSGKGGRLDVTAFHPPHAGVRLRDRNTWPKKLAKYMPDQYDQDPKRKEIWTINNLVVLDKNGQAMLRRRSVPVAVSSAFDDHSIETAFRDEPDLIWQELEARAPENTWSNGARKSAIDRFRKAEGILCWNANHESYRMMPFLDSHVQPFGLQANSVRGVGPLTDLDKAELKIATCGCAKGRGTGKMTQDQLNDKVAKSKVDAIKEYYALDTNGMHPRLLEEDVELLEAKRPDILQKMRQDGWANYTLQSDPSCLDGLKSRPTQSYNKFVDEAFRSNNFSGDHLDFDLSNFHRGTSAALLQFQVHAGQAPSQHAQPVLRQQPQQQQMQQQTPMAGVHPVNRNPSHGMQHQFQPQQQPFNGYQEPRQQDQSLGQAPRAAAVYSPWNYQRSRPNLHQALDPRLSSTINAHNTGMHNRPEDLMVLDDMQSSMPQQSTAASTLYRHNSMPYEDYEQMMHQHPREEIGSFVRRTGQQTRSSSSKNQAESSFATQQHGLQPNVQQEELTFANFMGWPEGAQGMTVESNGTIEDGQQNMDPNLDLGDIDVGNITNFEPDFNFFDDATANPAPNVESSAAFGVKAGRAEMHPGLTESVIQGGSGTSVEQAISQPLSDQETPIEPLLSGNGNEELTDADADADGETDDEFSGELEADGVASGNPVTESPNLSNVNDDTEDNDLADELEDAWIGAGNEVDDDAELGSLFEHSGDDDDEAPLTLHNSVAHTATPEPHTAPGTDVGHDTSEVSLAPRMAAEASASNHLQDADVTQEASTPVGPSSACSSNDNQAQENQDSSNQASTESTEPTVSLDDLPSFEEEEEVVYSPVSRSSLNFFQQALGRLQPRETDQQAHTTTLPTPSVSHHPRQISPKITLKPQCQKRKRSSVQIMTNHLVDPTDQQLSPIQPPSKQHKSNEQHNQQTRPALSVSHTTARNFGTGLGTNHAPRGVSGSMSDLEKKRKNTDRQGLKAQPTTMVEGRRSQAPGSGNDSTRMGTGRTSPNISGLVRPTDNRVENQPGHTLSQGHSIHAPHVVVNPNHYNNNQLATVPATLVSTAAPPITSTKDERKRKILEALHGVEVTESERQELDCFVGYVFRDQN